MLFSLLLTLTATGAVRDRSPQSAGGPEGAGAAGYKTHDELLLDIGTRVPEFGGMYLSADNSILYVYVLDGQQDILNTEEVKRAITEVLKDDPTTRRELRLVPAQYSMLQLYKWYSAMQGAVWRNPQVNMTDLDEGENRIEIDVDNLDVADELETVLAALGIPRKAVVIRVIPRPVLATHELSDRAPGDRLEGGFQTTGVGACTLGFNVDRSGEEGFITVGHCTQSGVYNGGVNSTKFYQPDSTVNPTAIGTETIDPPFTSGLLNCEPSEECRFSDSAFIKYNTGISRNLGKIAKPPVLGHTTVDHTGPQFRIVKDATVTQLNEIVYKVGRKTGWTKATVTDTCTKVSVPNPLPTDPPNNKRLLCQVKVQGHGEIGDSGSPVFRITNSPDPNDVELLGILWAVNTPANVFWYSSIGNIYNELALIASETWNSCDPAIGC